MLGQTCGDFELVISDNASTDGTEEICRRYVTLDKRVRYIRRTENIGGPGNFRYVFAQCTGQYHKWSTADDFWHPKFLEEAVAVLDGQPDVVLCYPKTRLIDASGAALSDYNDRLDLTDDSPRTRFRDLYRLIGLCNAHLGLIRREAMLRTSLIAAHKASDVDFLGELVLIGKFRLLPEYASSVVSTRSHRAGLATAKSIKDSTTTRPVKPRATATSGAGCASNGRCCGAARSVWATSSALSKDLARWTWHQRVEPVARAVGTPAPVRDA